ncbi:MAG: acyl carrier protein [Gemmataceae bacterium]|nr:acyl carrier protein [Gemmataceae bacterium]
MCNRDHIRQTLIQFLKEDTPAPTEGLTDATSLRDGLGLDSVDFVGLVMRVEGHYHIRLSREDLESLDTLASLLDLIEARSAATEQFAAAA